MHIKQSNESQYQNTHQDLLSFILLGRLSVEQIPLNLGAFWWYFCISKLVKGWGVIKNPCF